MIQKPAKDFMMGHVIQWVLKAEIIFDKFPKFNEIHDDTALESYIMEDILPLATDERLQYMYILGVVEEAGDDVVPGTMSILGYHKDFDAPPRVHVRDRQGRPGYYPPMQYIEFKEGTVECQ